MGVGRCSDLRGATFFLNNKNVRNNAYMQYRLQYCNEVHYVNSGYSWGGRGGGRVALVPTPMFLISL